MPSEKKGRLTDFEKGQIIALRETKSSFSEIGKLLNRPKTTVQSFYNRYQTRGHEKNLQGTGRPKIIDTRTHRRLVRESKKAHHRTLSQLRNEVAPHVSVKTVKRALVQEKITKPGGGK